MVIAATALLLYAGYADIRRRSVSNALWLVMGGAGVVLAGYRAAVAGAAFLVPVSLSLVFTGLLAYLFFWLGYLGGADAKALICLALLFPVQPAFGIHAHGFPLVSPPAFVPFPPALLMLGNALVLALAVPVGLFLYNLYRGGLRGLAGNGALSFVAYRRQGRLSGGAWVTPQLPFMVFIALGFIAGCLLGV